MNKCSDTVLSAFLCAALVSARQMFIRHCVGKSRMEFLLFFFGTVSKDPSKHNVAFDSPDDSATARASTAAARHRVQYTVFSGVPFTVADPLCLEGRPLRFWSLDLPTTREAGRGDVNTSPFFVCFCFLIRRPCVQWLNNDWDHLVMYFVYINTDFCK